ncbi:MAG: hypothetical protein GY696_33465 [Gammaproteobacteria bacterium]|nr:hypothetical protein [Gammaproteobacteria bacterium]
MYTVLVTEIDTSLGRIDNFGINQAAIEDICIEAHQGIRKSPGLFERGIYFLIGVSND